MNCRKTFYTFPGVYIVCLHIALKYCGCICAVLCIDEVSSRASHGNHHAESILFCFFILHFSIFLFFIVILCILFVQLYKCIVLLSVQVSGLCPRRKGGILMWGIFLDWLLFVYTNNLPQNTDIGWKNVMSFCAHRKAVFALLFGSFIFCSVTVMDVRW